ncbi:uncharacterized protein EV154DRAFT_485617 [Mucor mucedo]|uniref:uncharacterized protein n=1 Tax=Mucor mucedo TaxID=29922 RepID=UPI00222043DD|nr:uncharacterized protein EV154DRAFT_485617 [Mucor mucedo]KAI7882290.1 hypothetical protein EV154DRAFT_485617 [Mucor mucedo]
MNTLDPSSAVPHQDAPAHIDTTVNPGPPAPLGTNAVPGTSDTINVFTARPMDIDVEFDNEVNRNGNNSKSPLVGPASEAPNSKSPFTGSGSAAPDRNTFEVNADRALIRIGEIQSKLAALYEKESAIMDVLPATIDDSNLRELQLNTIRRDIAHWNAQIVVNNDLYTSCKQTSVKLITSLAQVMKLDDAETVSEKRQKDHSDIPAKEIPVFDVKYSDFDSNPDVHNPEDYSLKSFIRKFERVYKNYGVDVELHWLFHLEASFENNDLYNNWFHQNFKSELKNKKKSWSDAKKVLEHRFDASARLGIVKTNMMLYNLKQYSHEQLAQFMDRYGACVRAARVQTQENFYFTVNFLMSLYTNRFQEKVKERMDEYMKLNPLNHDSSMASKHANLGEDQFFEYYSNFGRVCEALNHFLGELEVSLKEIQTLADAKPSANPTAPSESSTSGKKDATKKRKLEVTPAAVVETTAPSVVNLERVYDHTYELSADERRFPYFPMNIIRLVLKERRTLPTE